MTMRPMLLAAVAALALSACSQGEGERAGEATDNAVEDATGASRDLTDGPAENAGEAVDDLRRETGEAAREAGDAAERAGEKVEREVDEATTPK